MDLIFCTLEEPWLYIDGYRDLDYKQIKNLRMDYSHLKVFRSFKQLFWYPSDSEKKFEYFGVNLANTQTVNSNIIKNCTTNVR